MHWIRSMRAVFMNWKNSENNRKVRREGVRCGLKICVNAMMAGVYLTVLPWICQTAAFIV